MKRGLLLAILLLSVSTMSVADDDVWDLQNSGVVASLRGICAVCDACCWASGAAGTVVRTVDGGVTWQAVGPDDATTADFRDIEAWDESTAVIMSAGDVDRLYRTEDGGKSWRIVYEHPDSVAFFDGMSFDRSKRNGWLMGDPIDGRLQLLTTDDAGKTWTQSTATNLPTVENGVAAFAASGTHLLCVDKTNLFIGLGGVDMQATSPANASVLVTNDGGAEWNTVEVPVRTGTSSGVFSIAAIDPKFQRLVLVGGDYLKPDQATDNIAVSDDGGRSWRLPAKTRPTGFRSAVVSVPAETGTMLLTVGPTGTDQSTDGGESWGRVSETGFHTMSFRSNMAGWAAGSNGRIARWRRTK